MENHLLEKPMVNSHLLTHDFDYFEVVTLDEIFALLTRYAGKARMMAGGTDLVVMMKMEREKPEAIINITKIPGLKDIHKAADGSTSIGPLVTIYDLQRNSWIRQQYPALAEACASFGSTQVEAMGTLGGNICNGSPAADTPPALIALKASVVLASKNGKRTLPIEEFFLAPGKTALAPDEVLVEVLLPPPAAGAGSVFLKMTRVAADLAKASLGLQVVRQGDVLTSASLGMGAVAPRPIRLTRTEELLKGRILTPELIEEAANTASEEITPIDDVRSTADYRRKVTRAMLTDALTAAWDRAFCVQDALIPAQAAAEEEHAVLSALGRVHAVEHKKIEFILNGRKVSAEVAPNELLLNVLRNHFQLTGTKYACGIGECSACTVQIDGKPMLSCLILAVSVSGKHVTTVEGLQDPQTGELDKLQEAFIENTAFQCGYCTPGMLMTAEVLLKEIPQPTEDQVRHYLRGNFCRCTGYASIVRAVLAAAAK